MSNADPIALFYQAASMPDYSPPAELAKAVCLMRQQDPYEWASTPWGGMNRWKVIILEAAIMAALTP